MSKCSISLSLNRRDDCYSMISLIANLNAERLRKAAEIYDYAVSAKSGDDGSLCSAMDLLRKSTVAGLLATAATPNQRSLLADAITKVRQFFLIFFCCDGG